MLTKDQILSANDLQREEVTVPEWGGVVIVRMMTGTEKDGFESEHLEAKKSGSELANIRARLAVRTVCDGEGNRLFADADAVELGKKNGQVLDRIFDMARRINGIGEK